HYGAVEGALASGFATAELHHLWGHDPADRCIRTAIASPIACNLAALNATFRRLRSACGSDVRNAYRTVSLRAPSNAAALNWETQRRSLALPILLAGYHDGELSIAIGLVKLFVAQWAASQG
ncbi:hypothetical protein E5S70_23125, partial [Ensifer adhaerens]|nr:hypothetical protein [Ensifer canadensis]